MIVDLGTALEHCPRSIDGMHTQAWLEGEACRWCGAPEMPMEQMVVQGMAEGPSHRCHQNPQPQV